MKAAINPICYHVINVTRSAGAKPRLDLDKVHIFLDAQRHHLNHLKRVFAMHLGGRV